MMKEGFVEGLGQKKLAVPWNLGSWGTYLRRPVIVVALNAGSKNQAWSSPGAT